MTGRSSLKAVGDSPSIQIFLILRFKEATMIRVTGLYRDMSNSEFDFDYYVNVHICR